MRDTSNGSESGIEMKEGKETDHYAMEDATVPHMEEDNTAYDGKSDTENDEGTDSFFSDETLNTPIYEGHTMTLDSSVLMILIYAMTHSITVSELADLLTIINAHCLYEIPLYSSL